MTAYLISGLALLVFSICYFLLGIRERKRAMPSNLSEANESIKRTKGSIFTK